MLEWTIFNLLLSLSVFIHFWQLLRANCGNYWELIMTNVQTDPNTCLCAQWRIQGGGQGGQDPPPPLRFPGRSSCTWKIDFICWRIVSKFVWLDISPKDDQNRGEDTNISKIVLGENPQNNQSQYNGFHNPSPASGGQDLIHHIKCHRICVVL